MKYNLIISKILNLRYKCIVKILYSSFVKNVTKEDKIFFLETPATKIDATIINYIKSLRNSQIM